ncbi:MAG TPA: glycerol kinase GlpK [Longimicrobiales bacterium]|nr:glycerol kinase GlpK [Longimicrobiales bacterium]
MPLILAIDQGTTGTTCMLVDEQGKVRARAYSEFTQHYPRPGWVEHDAAEIWDVTLRVARDALAEVGAPGRGRGAMEEVAAIGITNQRETVVLWDRATGEPVHRAIVWQDRRTTALCRSLKERGEEGWVRQKTGLLLDPYFSATKLAWVLDEDAELRRRAEAGELAAGTIDSWLIWKLTGGRVHATDHTNASRTLLYDIHARAWDDELLALFGVPRAILPEVRPSSGVFGETPADLLGMPLPVAGAAGDQQAALFGQGCYAPGAAKNTYGTGAFLLLHTGSEPVASERGLLTTVACDARGEPAYALEGAIFIAGAAVQWLRDELGIIEVASETEALARSLQGNEGVYLVPAFVGLGAPHWEPEARGTVVGLTRGSGRAHLARAALEAMAYSTRDVLAAMEAESGHRAEALTVDGGASDNGWLMQFQADLLDLPVLRPQVTDTTALGAAGLAGVAVGVWPDGDAFVRSRAAPDRFEPDMAAEERVGLVAGWERALEAARVWAASAP